MAQTDQQFVADSPVVLNLGNNNRLVESEVISMMEVVRNQPKIIVVNTAVPRSWKDENNQIISSVVADIPIQSWWTGIASLKITLSTLPAMVFI